MPAKKVASKKRKNASTSRKKVTAKKPVTKTKVSKTAVSKKKVSKKKVSKKKVSKKKVSKKKAPSRKKVINKSAAKKKAPAKKTATKKKVSKKKPIAKPKASRKTSSKKAAPAPKAVVKKVPPRKPAPVRRAGSGDPLSGPIHGIAPYKPARGEEYMSAEQLEHFRRILKAWKNELMFEVDRTVHHMQDEAANFPDPNDRATQESEFGLELRTRDRERKLLRKIESALSRLDDGSYGYCDETGEEIGLKRLEARPVATLSLEAQERRELSERQYRDRDDRYR